MAYGIAIAETGGVDLYRFGRSKQVFRGPKPDLRNPYLTFIGGSEPFGKFVLEPYPKLVEKRIGQTCVNLGTTCIETILNATTTVTSSTYDKRLFSFIISPPVLFKKAGLLLVITSAWPAYFFLLRDFCKPILQFAMRVFTAPGHNTDVPMALLTSSNSNFKVSVSATTPNLATP